jgi:Fe-Mn family superoxide dismutase
LPLDRARARAELPSASLVTGPCRGGPGALRPRPGRGELARAIEASFGSLDALKAEFSKKAEEFFGSGWVWLAKGEKGKLVVCATGNADNPLLFNMEPLLACDVWEHAYYLDYRNSRKDFLRHFWKIAHWEFVEERFRGPTH